MDSVNGGEAGVTEDSLLEQVFVGVDVVEDCVCIVGVGGCEDDDLPVFLEFSDYFLHVGTDVDPQN